MVNHSDRENFMCIWLETKEPNPAYTKFEHKPLAERIEARPVVIKPCAETIFLYHNDPVQFREHIEYLGYQETANAIDNRPKDTNTRRGNFGEVIASEYLRQRKGYYIPVYCLRYSRNPESAMKGDDILAFKLGEDDGSGREMLVGEVKVRSQFASCAVEEAYKNLSIGQSGRPKSLQFILRILRDQGKTKEERQIREFLLPFGKPRPRRRYAIFLITGNKPREPFGCIQEKPDVIRNLLVFNLVLKGLGELVDLLFEMEVDVNGF
ncbi:DUF1837 domain-containing protein [bacterium]|nr:DUF1837 domain-containing protein [bacterium]